MSIRWVKNVLIDGAKSTIEIQIGDKRIGDKSYIRVSGDVETWFEPSSAMREEVIAQGIEILKRRLHGKNITFPDGRAFDWR
jgi:hypothetical protein